MFMDISQSIVPQLFFISFWVLTVLIITNLVISNIIEIYDSVEGTVKTRFSKNTQVKHLLNMDLSELEHLVQITQLA